MKALINIEFVQGCENNCIACSSMNKREVKFMNSTTLEKVVNDIKNVFKDDLLIKVFGIGNSLLHPEFISYCSYLSNYFPQSMLTLSSNYRDILKYKTQINSKFLNRIILTIQPFDLNLAVLKTSIDYLKYIGIEQIRIVYLTPSFVRHELIIQNLVNFCNENLDNYFLLVMRFLKHLFGYSDSYKPTDIPYFYEENLQNNTEDKARIVFGNDLFYLQTKGFKNWATLNPVVSETEPSCAIDYLGNLHTCISRNSPFRDLKYYSDNYLDVVKYCCDDCPVMAEDFVLQISKRPIEKVRISCRCLSCEDYIRCP